MDYKGLNLNFDPLNATDLDRMQRTMDALREWSAAEQTRIANTPGVSPGDVIRGQCKLVRRFIDEVFGEGASDQLGIPGDNLRTAQTIIQDLTRVVREQAKPAPLLGVTPANKPKQGQNPGYKHQHKHKNYHA